MAESSRKNDLFATLAVAILLIGTATGSGIAMFVLSATTLALMVVFNRKELKRKEYRSGCTSGCASGSFNSICHCQCSHATVIL